MEIENLHLATLALTALVILYSDHEGFLYMRQKKVTLSPVFVMWSHSLVWIGLLGMIITGIGLVLPAWEYYLGDPVFYVKMGFVLTLAVNGLFIGKLSHVATETPYALLDRDTKHTLMLSGALSATGWIGATIIGFFIL